MQDSDIRSLVAMGDHIAAIRSYVERHGVNLIAARAAIEAMRWELTQARGTGLGEVEREVDRLLKSGDRLGAIRHHRQASGGSLQASVEVIAARDKTAAPVAPESVDGRIAAGEKIAAIKRYRELSRSELKQAKDAVEARIAALAAGAAPSGDDWVPRPPPKLAPQDEIDALIRQNRKIDAIKRHRELHGVELKAAKDAVEARIAALAAAEAHTPASTGPAGPPGLQPELDRLILAGQKIMAIKHYREITRVGLKDAKDAVDARAAGLGR